MTDAPLVRYSLSESTDYAFLTVISPDGPLVATRETHNNFEELVAAARADDPVVFDLFDTGKVIERRFRDVANGRISVRGGEVFFDDDPLDSAISDKILDFVDADEDFSPLARYVENVMANPQKESREQFYRWIAGEDHHFPISDDGCIVAYKGVASDGKGGYRSINSGTAFVNNVKHTGQIPNAVGDVVSMPRSEVEFDPNVACHVGLHAGTWEYAKWFGHGTVMLVKVNPRDVVSVPHDSSSQKVRLCRYEVVGFATDKNEALRYVDEVVEGDLDAVKAEDEVAEAPAPKDVTKAKAVKPLANRSKVWHDGDKVVFVSGGSRGSVENAGKRGVVRDLRGPRKDDADSLYEAASTGAAWVYVGGKAVCVWDDELQADTTVSVSKKVASGVRDTRDNHKHQKRDRFGHFIKG